MDVNVLRVLGLEKLVDYAASGIGAVAGSMLAPWMAKQQAKAKSIKAKAQAESLQIIAQAQADARQALTVPNTTTTGTLEITREQITQRLKFQEHKRQQNIVSVVGQAAEDLGDEEVPDNEPDHDWTARFFNDIQDVSSEEMQSLWAKVLAGEVQRPGSTSIRTLSILRTLDQAAAGLFRTLCSACVSVRPYGNEFWDARIPSLGGNVGGNALEKYGLDYRNLCVLTEHELILSSYTSWYDIEACIASYEPVPGWAPIPFSFQGRYWVLVPTTQRDKDQEFKLSGVALTQSGQELSRIVSLKPMNEYTQALMKFFKEKNLQMIEVDSSRPQSA